MEDRAAVGKVINTHGVRGGLKVQPLSDIPGRAGKLKRVYVEKEGRSAEHHVVEAFTHGRFWIIRLEKVRTMDEAEGLVGSLITIPLSERMELPGDTYYLDQIIGLDVYLTDGTYLGRVTDVLQTGSNDVYVVKAENGREALIPALKSVIVGVDTTAGRMEVDPPEGLL